MSALGAFAFAGVALVGWIGLSWWKGRQNDQRLAAARPGMSVDALIEATTNAGADVDVARLVIDWIAAYYGPETTLHAADRMKADIAIDPGDLEFFTADFFRDNEMPQPTRKNPETLPDYNEATLTSFAVYLTQRRRVLLASEAVQA